MAHSHHEHRAHHHSRKRSHQILKSGGDHHPHAAADKGMVGALTKHHDAEPAKVHGYKRGGRVDKYARGGSAKKHHTQVNIAVVAPHGKDAGQGAAPAPGGAGMPPPHPPIAGGPPPGALPPGLPPGGPPPGAGGPPGLMPRPPMKRGGRIKRAHGGAVEKPIALKKLNLKGGMDSGEGRVGLHHFQRKHRPK